MDTIKDFWGRVKQLIKLHNTTQEKLAIAIEVSFSTLQGQIVKNWFPNVLDGYKIANQLHTTVEYLITGTTNEDNTEISKDILDLAYDINSLPKEFQQIIRTQIDQFQLFCFKPTTEINRNIG